jgi:hypothetical protein
MTWRMQGQAGEENQLLGREDDGVVEWEKPLESFEALEGRRHEKSSQFNEPRWIVQHVTFRQDMSLTHATRRFTRRTHYGHHKSPSDSRRWDVTLQRSGQ